MKYFALVLLALGLFLALPVSRAQEQQHNSITISVAGQFNPTSRVYINTDQQMISSNRSAVGGSVEYQRWLTPRNAVGFLYEQNPSDGKLVFQPVPPDLGISIWPQMQYDAFALFTQYVPLNSRTSIFTQEGAGANVTNGYGNSGWSHDTAFAEGTGTDYYVSRHTALEVSSLWIETETGCYNGRACKQTWATITETHVGLKVSW